MDAKSASAIPTGWAPRTLMNEADVERVEAALGLCLSASLSRVHHPAK